MSDQMRADAGHGDKLRGRVSEFVSQLLAGGQAGAAAHFGVHAETVRRWLHRPKVALAYEEAKQAQRDAWLDKARSMTADWLAELDAIIKDKEQPAAVRVNAIKTALDISVKADGQAVLEKLKREHEAMKEQLEEAQRRAGTRRIEVVHRQVESPDRPDIAGLLEGAGPDREESPSAVRDGGRDTGPVAEAGPDDLFPG